MRVIICCGGRVQYDRDFWREQLNKHRPDVIIHGGADGADKTAALIARSMGIRPIEVPALWEAEGKRAGPLRNEFMALLVRLMSEDIGLIADYGGTGTAHMVKLAQRFNIPLLEVR